MKILAINLRPDVTQIVEARIKNDILHIETVNSMQSLFPALASFNYDLAEDFFSDLRQRVKFKNAQTFMSLSDELIQTIDCGTRDFVSSDRWNAVVPAWISQFLQLDKTEYYITTPLHFPKKNRSIITGIGIRSTYIDLLYLTAIAAGLDLQLIEPSCYALLRYLNQWDREHCIVEVGEITTSIVGYNPVRGMFKTCSSYGWTHFLADEFDELEGCISSHDLTAYNTYSLANTNVPIYLISAKSKELMELANNREYFDRITKISALGSNSFCQSELLEQEIVKYCVPIGVALAPLHERMVSYGRSSAS